MLDTASRIELRTPLFQRKELNMSEDPIAILGPTVVSYTCINEHGVEINLSRNITFTTSPVED
jgi:hypothetical protein